MHVASTTLFEGPAPSYDDLRDHLAFAPAPGSPLSAEAPLRPPRPGPPRWMDDPHFNLDYHLRHTALPPPGQRGAAADAGGADLLAAPRPHKPLWEIWLVDGLEGGSLRDRRRSPTTALVDGVSGVDITTVLFDLDREPEPAAPTPSRGSPSPSHAAPSSSARRCSSAPPAARDRARRSARALRRRGILPARPIEGLGGGGLVRCAPVLRARLPHSTARSARYRRFAWVRDGPRRAEADQERRRRYRQRRGAGRGLRRPGTLPARRGALDRRTSSCARWSRSASARTMSTARWATGSRR